MATPFSHGCEKLQFVINEAHVTSWRLQPPQIMESTSCIAHTLLTVPDLGTLQATVSVQGEGLKDIGGLELLINMPMNIGCFKVTLPCYG